VLLLQVAWKLEETRKYYDMYNTLDTTLGFLQKEVKLLNSISENFHEAMKSNHGKLEFSKQFENIVKGVEVSGDKGNGRVLSFVLRFKRCPYRPLHIFRTCNDIGFGLCRVA
jgi:hypothetical protein